MSKFKAGDMVRATAYTYDFLLGEEGEVVWVGSVYLQIAPLDGSPYKTDCAANFELSSVILPRGNQSVSASARAPQACECGSEKVGSPRHSDYCPLFRNEDAS